MPTATSLERILQIIQHDPAVPGICFAAHPNDSGVLDRSTVEQWWSQDVIRNNDFLCMELPRPRDEYVAGPTSLVRSILLNSDTRYARRHPIASICNSDTKQLTATAAHETNFIGFRHSWLKMSAVTIEGIRQAFIDHESRIRRWAPRPRERSAVPHLVQQPGLWVADADPNAPREGQVRRRDRRHPEQQGCPSGARYEPMDGGDGAQGVRVVGKSGKRSWGRSRSA
jgi:hypothetical protein